MFYDLGQGSCSIPPLSSLQQSSDRVPPSFQGERNRLHLFVGNMKVLEKAYDTRSNTAVAVFETRRLPRSGLPWRPVFPSVLFSSVLLPLCTFMLTVITLLLASLATALRKKAC